MEKKCCRVKFAKRSLVLNVHNYLNKQANIKHFSEILQKVYHKIKTNYYVRLEIKDLSGTNFLQ